MAKVPVVLLDIADFRPTKDPQVVIGTEESFCAWAALHMWHVSPRRILFSAELAIQCR